MNANELSDELAKVIDVRHYASEVLRKEIITMLRQQQVEIEELKEKDLRKSMAIRSLNTQLKKANKK